MTVAHLLKARELSQKKKLRVSNDPKFRNQMKRIKRWQHVPQRIVLVAQKKTKGEGRKKQRSNLH